MLTLGLERIRKILCLGAHSDDIEIGCGGTMLRLIHEHPEVEVCWVVLGASGVRRDEALDSASRFLNGSPTSTVDVRSFRDSYFPDQWAAIKDYLHDLAASFTPDVVFTHRRDDAHQDHRVTGELTWCAFRNQMVLEYEIPKFEGDLGQPNVLIPFSESILETKSSNIVDAFASQRKKYWFAAETFRALARLRGLEANSEDPFAEGFHCRKLVL